jgi:3-methyladenine DNA glycosylase AlkD
MARDLWKSGNHDARVLATMIADPKQADESLLESWVRDLGNYVITDAVSSYIGQTQFAREKMEAWTKSDDEWIGTVGWNLLGHLAMKDQSLHDDYFLPYIEIIERTIHDRKNRVRYAMNNALIAIGIRSDAGRSGWRLPGASVSSRSITARPTGTPSPPITSKKTTARRKQRLDKRSYRATCAQS